MLILPGNRALSEFRINKLLEQVRNKAPEVYEIKSIFVHFLKVGRELAPVEAKTLASLLSESGQHPCQLPEGELFVITPRPGTISPWSSKATDILHNSALEVVERIERGKIISIGCNKPLAREVRQDIAALLYDRMTEAVFDDLESAAILFAEHEPKPLQVIKLGKQAKAALAKANLSLGLALSDDEIMYLVDRYKEIGRDPTDVELMMFAQANSEHCRHKIFNADWSIDGREQDLSLFSMIRNTHKKHPDGVLSAYSDNAAVLRGPEAQLFYPAPASRVYASKAGHSNLVIKVETHNHPTAISPFPGAATGSGGEIRDEGATGSGSQPKAGLTGFSVSNLKIPGFEQPWEKEFGKPDRIVSAREIMLEGPLGGAAFNNEFGRPGLLGYFRTFEQEISTEDGPQLRGYHKPIMIAGGVGRIQDEHVEKNVFPDGTPIIILGGPAMLIGLGGGAASSMDSGASAEDLDFASVQRGNPEMQRRCQEVINQCVAFVEDNPILSIHDIGAGGLSNAVPEIIHDAGKGGYFELRKVNNAEPGMSPMEIWCNEAQERYVLAVKEDQLELVKALCERERCPYAVIGYASDKEDLLLDDQLLGTKAVDIPMDVLFGKAPKVFREAKHITMPKSALKKSRIEIHEAVDRLLRLPTIASKKFLITIADRTITGLVARDQMVGPWQVPVADVAVTLSDYHGYTGEAMAMGERPPVALLNPAASGRLAVAEAITNIAAARIEKLSDIKLSANWMSAAGHPGEDVALYETVRAVGMELCPELGIAIPVGKDSLSLKTVWQDGDEQKEMPAPLSLVITAFAPVLDARKTLTPQLKTDIEESHLIFIDLGLGQARLGGSCLAQVYHQLGTKTPDLDEPVLLKKFFTIIQSLNEEGKLLAYHDVSDGGLFITLCEMAFAGRTGLEAQIKKLNSDSLSALFAEEPGAVIQVAEEHMRAVTELLDDQGLGEISHRIGQLTDDDRITINSGKQVLFSRSRTDLKKAWAETSYEMQKLRDNPECAEQEFKLISAEEIGMQTHIRFDAQEDIAAPMIQTGIRPPVAILREEGVNGHVEMAAAFDKAGFNATDVHMTDIGTGHDDLTGYAGIVACGGFSYGDVLGAGGGWAKSILHNNKVADIFSEFFAREDVFGLGVCNGCQMFSQLRGLIPGAENWPWFRRNQSEQFEARFSMVEVLPTPSMFLTDMQGSHLPVAVAHGEGKAVFEDITAEAVEKAGLVALRYIDHYGHETENYPQNPNGSINGITGLTTADGRFTIMMPHPERVFRTVQNSWHPKEWGEDGPWLRMFRNARVWVG